MLSFKKSIKSTVLMFYVFKSFFISSYSLHRILHSSRSEIFGFSDWAHSLLSLSFWSYILSLGNAFLSFVYLVKSTHFLTQPKWRIFSHLPKTYSIPVSETLDVWLRCLYLTFKIRIYLPGSFTLFWAACGQDLCLYLWGLHAFLKSQEYYSG